MARYASRILCLAVLLALGCASSPFADHLEFAESGNAEAQHWVGSHFYHGVYVDRNYERAAYWIRRAADQGHVGAQNSIGALLALGRGVDLDYTLARYYFEGAADQGDAGAQYNLAGLYARGQGGEQDWNEAARLVRLSAEQNNGKAIAYLAYLYEKGLGVEQDHGEALRWYRIAVEEGIDTARTGFAMSLWRNGRMPEAIATGREALSLAPRERSPYVALSNLLRMDGQHKEAIAILERAHEIDPQDPTVLNNLAWLLATTHEPQLRDPERALELVQRALENSEVPPADTLDTLAEAHYALGHIEEAIEAVHRALAANPPPDSEPIMREHLIKYEQATTHRSNDDQD